jgi:hypothetical protein
MQDRCCQKTIKYDCLDWQHSQIINIVGQRRQNRLFATQTLGEVIYKRTTLEAEHWVKLHLRNIFMLLATFPRVACVICFRNLRVAVFHFFYFLKSTPVK